MTPARAAAGAGALFPKAALADHAIRAGLFWMLKEREPFASRWIILMAFERLSSELVSADEFVEGLSLDRLVKEARARGERERESALRAYFHALSPGLARWRLEGPLDFGEREARIHEGCVAGVARAVALAAAHRERCRALGIGRGPPSSWPLEPGDSQAEASLAARAVAVATRRGGRRGGSAGSKRI